MTGKYANGSISVISNDAVFARMLCLYLEKHGYTAKAFSVLKRYDDTPALLITDCDCLSNGAENALSEKARSVPVIGFSAAPDSLNDSILNICSIMKTRPFSNASLLSDISGLLGTHSPAVVQKPIPTAPQMPERPSLVLRGRIAYFGDKYIHLTDNEAVVLSLLSNAGGIPISKEAVRKVLHSEDGDCKSQTNIAEVYICFLRKKLASLSEGIIIRYTRGVGYKLICP